MRERSCGVPEERWIDLLDGRLSERDAQALMAHKGECRDCRDTYAQWVELLGAESRAAPALSAGRRRSLLLRACVHAFARRTGRAWRAAAKRPALAASCGLGAAVVATLLLLHPFATDGGKDAGNELSPAGYARLHEPAGASVLSEPDTVVYKSGEGGRSGMAIGLPGGAKETLWLNARTHELFLLMEGLLPSARTDVQAWARFGATNANLGLLSFHDSRAHLYAANVRPEEWESVLLTIEPKGGSAMPTRPETVSIPLREATQ